MKKIEFGRSMVEILGVLAIIGVLSVTGLYGYTVAMRKHKTNEMIRELIVRANQISSQLLLSGDVSGVTLEDAFLPSGTYSFRAENIDDNRFKVTMTGASGSTIPVDICRQLYSDIGTNTVILNMGQANNYTSASDCGSVDLNSLNFTFNKDLSH